MLLLDRSRRTPCQESAYIPRGCPICLAFAEQKPSTPVDIQFPRERVSERTSQEYCAFRFGSKRESRSGSSAYRIKPSEPHHLNAESCSLLLYALIPSVLSRHG